MKFSFNLKGRKEDTARYTSVNIRTQDQPFDLYTAMIGVFPQGAFHAQSKERLAQVRTLIRSNEPVFVAKLAVYLREDLQQKHLAFILSAELSAAHDNAAWTCQLAGRILHEAVEIAEWMEYYTLAVEATTANTSPGTRTAAKPAHMPSRLRKTLAPLFIRLDAFHFSRYTAHQQQGLKQALSAIRPGAASKTQRALFDKILHNGIPARSNWNAEWNTLAAQSYDSPAVRSATLRDKYKEGISSFRMGYPGLLENLQPILAMGISGKVLKLAAEYIAHPAAVAGTQPSPLQLLAAWRKLKGRREGGVPLLLEALETAAQHSVANLGLDEKENLVIAMDVSNSMKAKLGEGSCIQRYDVGPLLTLMLRKRTGETTAGIIGNTWKPVNSTNTSILAGVDPFHRREGEAGYAINAHLVILDLLKKRKAVDKIMIFTDSPLWDNRPLHQPEVPDLVRAWQLYRRIAPNAKLCLFDMAGYGHRPLEIPEEGVYMISGWHDNIFQVLKTVDDKDILLDRINNIEA